MKIEKKLLIIIWVVQSAVESYVIQLFAPLLKQWGFQHDSKNFLLTAQSTLHPLTLPPSVFFSWD